MQGWTPDFIPKLTQGRARRRPRRPGRRRSGARALAASRELARREGIFCGLSGGATLAARADRRRSVAGRQRRALHGARHRRALPVDTALRRHPRGDDRSRARDRRLDRRLPHRRPVAPGAGGRRGARADARRRLAWFDAADRRPGPAGRHVRPRMVRVLLGAPQVLRAPRHSLPLGRPQLGRAAGGRPRRRAAGGAAAPHRRADDPAGLRRRHPRRRLHRDLRRLRRRQPRLRLLDRHRVPHGTARIDTADLLPKWLHPRGGQPCRG